MSGLSPELPVETAPILAAFPACGLGEILLLSLTSACDFLMTAPTGGDLRTRTTAIIARLRMVLERELEEVEAAQGSDPESKREHSHLLDVLSRVLCRLEAAARMIRNDTPDGSDSDSLRTELHRRISAIRAEERHSPVS